MIFVVRNTSESFSRSRLHASSSLKRLPLAVWPFLLASILPADGYSCRTADCRLGRDVGAYSALTHTYAALLSLLQTLKPIAFSGCKWNTCRITCWLSLCLSCVLCVSGYVHVCVCRLKCWCRLQIQLYNSHGGHLYNCFRVVRESDVAAFLFCNHISAAVLALLSVRFKCCPALIFMIFLWPQPMRSFNFMRCFDHLCAIKLLFAAI